MRVSYSDSITAFQAVGTGLIPVTRSSRFEKLVYKYMLKPSGDFYQHVYSMVSKVPKGKVLSYGQVAAMVGNPRAAQAVGWALRALPAGTKVPWQRVVNSQGVISIKNIKAPKSLQAELLTQEGVVVKLIDGKFTLDMQKYMWRAKLK